MKSTVSKALRNIVAERDSYTCILCTNPYSDMHHVIPRSRGGRNNPENLVSLCRPCHMTLHRELTFVHDALKPLGYESVEEFIDIARLRMIEYLSDYYADKWQRGGVPYL